MILTLLAVGIIDVVVVSLLTARLRFWMPVWIDPQWSTNPDTWVAYSQSYLAGIVFIPFLAYAVDRDLLASRAGWVRAAFWLVCLAAMGYIAWWKGGLMIEHDKQREGLAWVALTAIIWGLYWIGERLPGFVKRLGRRQLVRLLLLCMSGFFLIMAVIDPALQVGAHGLGWSKGLIVEVAFFIPVGIGSLLLARRLNMNPDTPGVS